MESAPSEGPTEFSSRYLTLAGKEPDRRYRARSSPLPARYQSGNAAGVFDLALNGGHADGLVIQHHRQLIVDVFSVKTPKRRPASGESVKLVSHF